MQLLYMCVFKYEPKILVLHCDLKVFSTFFYIINYVTSLREFFFANGQHFDWFIFIFLSFQVIYVFVIGLAFTQPSLVLTPSLAAVFIGCFCNSPAPLPIQIPFQNFPWTVVYNYGPQRKVITIGGCFQPALWPAS